MDGLDHARFRANRNAALIAQLFARRLIKQIHLRGAGDPQCALNRLPLIVSLSLVMQRLVDLYA